MSEEVIMPSRTNSKDPDNPETSTLMSRILSSDNINETELTLRKQFCNIFECIVRNNNKSFIDCSFYPGSDEDLLKQIPELEVIDVENCETSQAGNVLVMNTNNCTPGYTLLKAYKFSQNLSREDTKSFLDSFVENEYGLVLSSEHFMTCTLHGMAEIQTHLPKTFHTKVLTRHGPCVMFHFFNHAYYSDVGLGLKCLSWPKEAMEWISRRRESNWPDAVLIDKIKTMPCHVMPVGFPDSDKCFLEWRFAFILQERELIWNLNDVQIQCFIIFKALKKEFLDEVTPDEINSFHVKTILFWLSEKAVKWERSTLFENVRMCLRLLDECIKEKNLSHYFLISRNLFAGKFKDNEVRTRLSSEITRIQGNILECFLCCKWSYQYGNHLLHSVRLLLKKYQELDIFEAGIVVLVSSLTCEKFQRNIKTYARRMSMWSTMAVMVPWSDPTSMMNIVKEVGNQGTLMGIYAIKYIFIRVGMIFFVEAKTKLDKDERQAVFSMAKLFLESGLGHDVLADHLYLLTYHYFTRSYDAIATFLKDLFSRHQAIIYEGTPNFVKCGTRQILSPDMDETITFADIKNENDVAFDVVFSYRDILCVPPALQYECALLYEDLNSFFCSINPLVYACYIQYQVALDQGDLEHLQAAVEHLRKMVLYVKNGDLPDRDPVELHRHYNVLGYCYYVMDDVKNAIQWFVKSLEECSSPGNAAAYHLCILLFNARTNYSKPAKFLFDSI